MRKCFSSFSRTAKAKEDMGDALKKMDQSLKDQTFLVGDKITLADIVLASTLLYPFKLVCDKTFLAPYPNVVRWFEACVGQPEFEAVVGKIEICETSLASK
jgi:elongation factor 1-gamma